MFIFYNLYFFLDFKFSEMSYNIDYINNVNTKVNFNSYVNLYISIYNYILKTLNSFLYNNIFNIEFYINVNNNTLFIKPLQYNVYTISNETTLVFFRLYNPNNTILQGITTYTVYPSNLYIYINKIQCFCFEKMIIKPYESVDLPILFYLDSQILKVDSFNHISIMYSFFNV